MVSIAMPMTLNTTHFLPQTLMFQLVFQHVWQASSHRWQPQKTELLYIPGDASPF